MELMRRFRGCLPYFGYTCMGVVLIQKKKTSLFTSIPYSDTQGGVSALQRGFSLVTCMQGFSLILKFTLNIKLQGGADAALQRVFSLVACMHGFSLVPNTTLPVFTHTCTYV